MHLITIFITKIKTHWHEMGNPMGGQNEPCMAEKKGHGFLVLKLSHILKIKYFSIVVVTLKITLYLAMHLLILNGIDIKAAVEIHFYACA